METHKARLVVKRIKHTFKIDYIETLAGAVKITPVREIISFPVNYGCE